MSLNLYLYLNILSLLILLIFIMVGVAFLTLMERKILGYIQDRKGPNKNLFLGLFQPFNDALKLLSKEMFFLNFSNYNLYYLSPLMSMFFSMILWLVFPFLINLYSFKFNLLFILCCLSLNSYTIMIGGWASNSNYSMLGSIRSVAQCISYEISFVILMFLLFMLSESFSLVEFIQIQLMVKFFLILFPVYIVFLISVLSELNRSPFDLIEGESELVSGFNTEYFSGMFTLIFLSEYMNILFMVMLMILIFWGLNIYSLMFLLIFVFKVYFMIWIRGVLPRIRYDMLMYLCWKKFLPVVLNYLFFIYGVKILYFYYLS